MAVSTLAVPVVPVSLDEADFSDPAFTINRLASFDTCIRGIEVDCPIVPILLLSLVRPATAARRPRALPFLVDSDMTRGVKIMTGFSSLLVWVCGS